MFGAIGALVAWDMDGRELWRVDLGALDSGWFLDPSYQWGHASSPIIYGDSVIVQAVVQKGSFLAAYDVGTGELRWKTARPDEISTWGTPGVYIPTPLVYRDHLYMLAVTGVVTAFEPSTGKRAFRGRVGAGGSFSASPVAADGKLYIATEDGDIHVVSAGPGLTPIAKNAMNEVIMATPAIADGLIFVRTLGHLYAIGR